MTVPATRRPRPSAWAVALAAASTLLASGVATAAPIKLGLLGDSIVDDYLGPPSFIGVNTNLAAGSFGQIMAVRRPSDFDFGGYRTPPVEWDGIRNSGYEYNWATAGAAASANAVVKLDFGSGFPAAIPVASNLALQTAGLAPLITAGQVDTVYMGIGGNDFFYKANVVDIVNGGLYPAADGAIDAAFINDVANSMLDSVATLRAAGPVDIIVSFVPTIPIMDQAQIDGVAAVNAILQAQAPVLGFTFFDSQEWSRTGSNVDPVTRDITIGGRVVTYASAASAADIGTDGIGLFCTFEGLCPRESHANYYLAEDGIHLNTLMQGQLANEIIKMLNQEYGRNVPLITDAELLGLVGLTPVPVPAGVWLLGSALGLLGWVRRRSGYR